jgi:hypothetical protein
VRCAARPRAIGAAVALGLVALGCAAGGPRARAESAALRREAETLRGLIAAVEGERAPSARYVTLGIGQSLLREVLELALPIEADSAPDVHVRLESAQVAFEDGESRVRLAAG